MTDVLPLDIGVEAFFRSDDEAEDRSDGWEVVREDRASSPSPAEGEEGGVDDGGLLDVVLPKHTKLPATALRSFRCERPDQPGVSIDLFEGDQRRAWDNDFVGRFTFMITRRRPPKVATRPVADGKDEDESSEEAPREVLLRFTMTESSYLTVEMVDDDYKGSGKSDNQDEKSLELLLVFMVLVLAALYLALRMTVRHELDAKYREQESQSSGDL